MKYRKQFMRVLFFVFLLACLLTGLAGTVRVPARAAPQMQAAALSVVINEISWAGTAASATHHPQEFKTDTASLRPCDDIIRHPVCNCPKAGNW